MINVQPNCKIKTFDIQPVMYLLCSQHGCAGVRVRLCTSELTLYPRYCFDIKQRIQTSFRHVFVHYTALINHYNKNNNQSNVLYRASQCRSLNTYLQYRGVTRNPSNKSVIIKIALKARACYQHPWHCGISKRLHARK